jgi:DNA polymerase
VSGWAEGFFAAAVKRAGQALELRLAIERVFDAEPGACIAVCGDFSRVRLANAIPFRPIERSPRGRLRNRTPTQSELRTFGQSVLSDVAKVKPAVIVALGKSAAILFGVSTPIEQARKHAVLFDGTPVRVTYHPSYVLRFGGKGSRLWKSTVRDLNRSWIEAQTRPR